jgi:hypothetical protein
MENLQLQKKFHQLESEFHLFRGILSILFYLSFTGIAVGLFGWILSPGVLWKIPVSYYILITTAAVILLGLTYVGRLASRNLTLTFSRLKADR